MTYETRILEEIESLVQESQAIYDQAAQDGNRQLSDAESREIEQLNTRGLELKRQLTLKKGASEFQDWAAEPTTEAEKPEEGGETRSSRTQDSRKFRTLGEMLLATAKANSPGGNVDKRLTTRASGLSEGTPGDGGFLIQTDFSSELLRRAYQTGVIATRARKIPLSQNATSIKIPAIAETDRGDGSRWGGIQAYWGDEAAAKTKSKPEFAQIELTLNKLVALCYATDELLQDAVALESVLIQGFGEEFGFKLDDALINGSGAGRPLGILNSPSLVTASKEAGQVASTIVYENIVNMWARLYAPSRTNAVWFINQDCEPQLHTMSLAIGTGGVPVYLPAGGASASPYATLYGRPVIPVEQCQTLGTVGDIILADFSQYILVDKGGMQSSSSIHVRFAYDEMTFRFVYRCDGAPWWKGTLTPYAGTNTQSPFIVLESR